MHILRVADIPGGPPGGGNRFMRESGVALQALGHEVDYVFREDLFPRVGGGGKARARRALAPWLVLVAIRRRIKQHGPYDVVEIRETDAAAYCLARRFDPKALPPCAVIVHGSHERGWRAQKGRWKALGKPVPIKSRLSVPLTIVAQSRYALRHADQALVLNEMDRDYLQLDLGVAARQVSRVNTGVSESYFSIPRRTRGPVRRLLFVGSWGDRKGRDRKGERELVRAWQEVAKRKDLSLAIIGTQVPEEIVRAVFCADLRGRVSVHPQVTEQKLQDELARADAFVLPSWFEGMPLATLEAAAAGLPCIVTAIPGHREIFRTPDPEADGAILVPPHDSGALAAAVERLTADQELAQRLGGNARQRARRFTWGETATQLEAAFRRAVEE